MRLIVECEHGHTEPHDVPATMAWRCDRQTSVTDPGAILAALAEAGWLEVESWPTISSGPIARYVSPWKEAK